MKLIYSLLALVVLSAVSCYSQNKSSEKNIIMDSAQKKHGYYSKADSAKLAVSDDEWKKILPSDVYYVARQKGTERPWTSKYENFHDTGTYYCAVCGNALFKSDTKFESGCGWPSFYEPITKGSVIYAPDYAYGMNRTEVMCGRCKSHLGHVFEDGPPPTHLRFCINGVVLDFEKAQEAEKNYSSQKKEND
ncbi:MAG TPA: peptide-methionine (R)-S-oxide reductase MsrB [Chitinophagaceae bacterium]|nr:peptide-methionine (R)-S-oxide reductase MsrB [Chitinophagaceae bacterium]